MTMLSFQLARCDNMTLHVQTQTVQHMVLKISNSPTSQTSHPSLVSAPLPTVTRQEYSPLWSPLSGSSVRVLVVPTVLPSGPVHWKETGDVGTPAAVVYKHVSVYDCPITGEPPSVMKTVMGRLGV